MTIESDRDWEAGTDEGRYDRRELHTGGLHRCIPLPADVKHEEAKAPFKDGGLAVRMPTMEKAAPRTIEIG